MKDKANRRRWNKVIAGVAFFYLLLFAIPVLLVQASSATITLATEVGEIHVGDIVEIQLTVQADTTIGDFEAFLKYDDTKFEFYSSVSCITGGAGMLKIADIGASPSQQDRVYRIFFKATAVGECEIALYERPIVYSYVDGTELSVTSFSKIFSILPSNNASSDNRLSALYIVDNFDKTVVLTPSFSSDIQTYAVTVGYEIQDLIVSAISTDDKASVEILGGKELFIGVNEVVITVIAEDGSEKVYTVFVRRLEEIEQIEAVEPKEIMLESGMTAKVEEETIWLTQYHTYIVCEKPEDFIIPDKYIETVLLINGVQITAYVNKEATEEQFLLLILQNEAEEIGWYRYDRVEQTLQRVCNEEYVITQVVQSNDEALQEALLQYDIQQKGLIIVVSILVGIVLSLLMVILWLWIRYKNREDR